MEFLPFSSRQKAALAEMIVFVVLAFIAVALRFVSRRLKRAGVGADDYMIVVGLFFTLSTFADAVIQVCLGIGRHTKEVPEANFTPLWKAIFVTTIVYATAIATIKFSILLFYQRLFITESFRVVTRVLGCIVLAWWTAVIIVQCLQCRPLQAIWNPSVEGKCINGTAYYIGVAVPNIATDIIMLCLPVRQVWRLQTNRVNKLALTCTFMTGVFVIFVSIYRIVQLHQENLEDSYWTISQPNVWTTLEPAIGIICACLPTLRPLLSLTPMKFGSKGKDSSRSIRLNDYESDPQTSKASNPITLIDDDLNLQPKSQVSHKTNISSTKHAPDAERDERLLPGVLVTRDVDIDRASASTSEANLR